MLLVAQSRMSDDGGGGGKLARTIYANKAELALEDGFALQDRTADVDKERPSSSRTRARPNTQRRHPMDGRSMKTKGLLYKDPER